MRKNVFVEFMPVVCVLCPFDKLEECTRTENIVIASTRWTRHQRGKGRQSARLPHTQIFPASVGTVCYNGDAISRFWKSWRAVAKMRRKGMMTISEDLEEAEEPDGR